MLGEVESELGGQGRRDGVRPRQAVVLAEYTKSFNISKAAAIAGVGRQLVWRWRSEDPVFHRCWLEANESVKDAVLGEVFERAMHGLEVAIRDRHGNIVGTERRPSDRLLIATAKALDDRFRETPLPTAAVREPAWRAHLIRILSDDESRAQLEAFADKLSGQ
jgi:hypothetical protein